MAALTALFGEIQGLYLTQMTRGLQPVSSVFGCLILWLEGLLSPPNHHWRWLPLISPYSSAPQFNASMLKKSKNNVLCVQIQYWPRVPWFSVCVYGSLGCGVCDRPVHPSCCSESLFPKPVTVAAAGLRDPSRHINLHLKGNCPMPCLCLCVRACARSAASQTRRKIWRPSYMTLNWISDASWMKWGRCLRLL